MNVLFLTWDGPQVSYLESLFLPIFAGLAEHGYAFHVVQFTWGPPGRREAAARACRAQGVPYTALRIYRGGGPVGYLLTLIEGILKVRRYVRENDISILMPRGTLTGTVARASRRPGMRIVFDADGFPWDLKVEFGRLKGSGFLYRVMRDLEAQVARSADRVICRTEFARWAIIARVGAGVREDAVSVVSNGRDASCFRLRSEESLAEARKSLAVPEEAPVAVYAGSLGGPYCLPAMAQFFRLVSERRSDARFLILTAERKAAAELRALCGKDGERVLLRALAPDDVPRLLGMADIGLNFRANTFSMRSIAPVKVGEYLLCGVPALTTHTAVNPTGDPDREALRLLDSLDLIALRAAADWTVKEVFAHRAEFRARARRLGERHFSLESTVGQYASVLQSLAVTQSVRSPVREETAAGARSASEI